MPIHPELSALLDEQIGQEWRVHFEELNKLNAYTATEETLAEFIQVKGKKKEQLFRYIEKAEGVKIGGERIVYAQVKRLHEYKRQLMTAFALLRLYYDLKEGKLISRLRYSCSGQRARLRISGRKASSSTSTKLLS